MIYLFHGSDSSKVRHKAFAWVTVARAKQPDASYVRLSGHDITEANLLQVAGTQGLFFSKTLVLIDDPFARKEEGELVLEHLDLLAQSQNPVAIVAPNLLVARVKKIEAKAERVFVIDATEKKPSRGFNTGLVNALGTKDAVMLWVELQKAYRLGDAPEMIHGLLHWKARDMMQKGNGRWGSAGTRKLSRELIELVSDSRGGDLPLMEALERFALRIK